MLYKQAYEVGLRINMKGSNAHKGQQRRKGNHLRNEANRYAKRCESEVVDEHLKVFQHSVEVKGDIALRLRIEAISVAKRGNAKGYLTFYYSPAT
jgi:hypothetical protein